MNRRTFSRILCLGTATFGIRFPDHSLSDGDEIPSLYYIDGYHGGIKGHMPVGAWRDILNSMRVYPDWKLSLEIEPASWEILRQEDPQSYSELKSYMADQSYDGRLEVLSISFAQSFGWAVGGESNIRQLLRGIEITKKHFPDAVLETYAVQEPCWTSCLPQILRSLGFSGAVLKNPSTAWGGYAAGYDADLVDWIGPDGSTIPAVPRYACEDLVNTWETDSVNGTPAFSQKCVAHGIPHPAGMCFQDLGWAARPKVMGNHIRHVTWREYIHTVADQPTDRWAFGIEDILVTLPWGEQTLQELAQQVRAAETKLLSAEKLSSMAWLDRGSTWPDRELREAWDQLLWAQHHDAWITATTRSGRDAWAFQVASETRYAEELAGNIIADAAEKLSAGYREERHASRVSQWIRVFNTCGVERSDLVELTLPTDRGTLNVQVFDWLGNEVPVQLIVNRRYRALSGISNEAEESDFIDPVKYRSESINTATILFRADVPSFGYASYRVEPSSRDEAESPNPRPAVLVDADNNTTVETDQYELCIDSSRGGAITRLFDKKIGKDLCDPSANRLFNEYGGYFVTQKRWHSSVNAPAAVKVVESGPIRIRAQVTGHIGNVPFQTIITLVNGQRRIDFQTQFTYEQDTWIGDPWDIEPEDRRTQRRRSHHDGRWKLQAFFPVRIGCHTVFKNAAFDVCRSRHSDTFFQKWDEIKHNIILDWVDIVDEHTGEGLAVFSDHTTAYTHGPDYPLALVMGWGWEGGFWWGKCPLRGRRQIRYAVLPHTGSWDEARIWEENSRWKEILPVQIMNAEPIDETVTRSILQVSRGVEISATVVDSADLLVRLFNAEQAGPECTVSFPFAPSSIDVVELDGRHTQHLELQPTNNGRFQVQLELPHFVIRTLRVHK